MRNVQLLIFDLEGTLLRPDDIVPEAIYGAIEETNEKFQSAVEYPEEETIWSWVGQPDFSVIKAIDPDLKKEPAEYMRLVMNKLMQELIEEGAGALYEGALDALKVLKVMGYRIAIICNYGRDYLITVLDYFNLYDYVDFSVCMEDVGHTDARDMIEDVLNNQQILPSETVFIGDRRSDIMIARELDIGGVGCEWGLGSAQELEDADRTVASPYDWVELFNPSVE